MNEDPSGHGPCRTDKTLERTFDHNFGQPGHEKITIFLDYDVVWHDNDNSL